MLNSKPVIPNPQSRIPLPKSPIPNPKAQVPDPKSHIPNPKSHIHKPESQPPSPKTPNPKPQSPNPRPQIPDPKCSIPMPKSQNPEGCWRSGLWEFGSSDFHLLSHWATQPTSSVAICSVQCPRPAIEPVASDAPGPSFSRPRSIQDGRHHLQQDQHQPLGPHRAATCSISSCRRTDKSSPAASPRTDCQN